MICPHPGQPRYAGASKARPTATALAGILRRKVTGKPLKVFVGYGYNERDRWIESEVLPILDALGFDILHGKDMHGEQLQEAVKRRIEQSEGLIGFSTLREGQANAEFNTHPWVRDEMVYALARHMPVIEIREEGVRAPAGIIGDRQRIQFTNENRLACVRELVVALSRWNVRQIQLIPEGTAQAKELRQAFRKAGFQVRYRTRLEGVDSEYFPARLDAVLGGLYLNARGLPSNALVEVQALLDGQLLLSSDWESVDAVQVIVR
jgi:hypothetical protein